MTKRKTLLYLVARAAMTLLLAVAGITNASAWWVGNSAVNLNGNWYYCGTNLNWCTGGAFDGADLGTITSLQLGGQSQVYADGYQWDYNSDGGEYGIKMGYKIDGIYVESQVITFQKIDFRDNNNICQSGGSAFSTVSIDISNLHPGEHTIEVWFVSNNVWDSNNSQNYKATFTISSGPVNYLKADGTTGTETATLLTKNIFTEPESGCYVDEYGYYVDNDGWYVVEDDIEFDNTLHLNGTINLVLADGADVTFTDGNGVSYDGSLFIYSQSTDNSQGSLTTEGVFNDLSGTLTINGSFINSNIYGICGDRVTINGGCVSAVNTDDYQSYGIDANYLTINGGTVTASGTDYGINANNTITINGGTVTASGTDYGINANNTITIKGGTVTATGYSGIYTEGIFTIRSGEVTANSEYDSGIYADLKITIDGGTINATGPYTGISSEYDIIINGGNVTATATDNSFGAIFSSDGYVIINGGDINATGVKYGIYCVNGITIAGGTVTSSSYNGTVKVADGFIYSDGTNNNLTGTINTSSYNSETTLSLIGANLTANSADGNYWSTFYFGSKGFTIDEGVNAFAYTATYGLNSETNEYEITLHKLGEDGKSIPEGTAVIIVSSTASVSMTPNDNLGKFSGTNNLHGVDVATATSDITSELGQGTIFVLGKTTGNDDFGFHRYTGETMPARKAFLLINEANNEALARGISVVFDDDSTTGIKAVNREERIVNSDDAWFDLQGRKIQEPTQRGLYIHNGKKIVVK